MKITTPLSHRKLSRPLRGFRNPFGGDSIPSFVPPQLAPILDVYADLKLNQAWVRQGNLILPASSTVTCARGSNGTQTDSSGNISLFTSNILARSNLGLVSWEARTNLGPNSNTSGGNWNSGSFPGTVIINTTDILDPMGGNTATKLVPNAGASNGYFQPLIPVTASSVYAVSFYVQLGTMLLSDFTWALFNETASSFIAQQTAVTLTPASNGWTRVTASVTIPVGCTSLRAYPYRNTAPVGSGSAYVWGLQVELGTSASPLILTAGGAATRLAEADSLNLAAIGNPAFGLTYSFFGQGTPQTPSTALLQMLVNPENTNSYRASASRVNNVAQVQCVMGSGGNMVFSAWPQNTMGKLAARISQLSQSASYNGSVTSTETTTLPALNANAAGIGCQIAGATRQYNGNVEAFGFAFNSGPTDAQLSSMTT